MIADSSIRQQFRTVQLVPLTAFDSDGALNLEPMRVHTQRLFDAGVRVFIPCAGSSEFHSLELEEIVAAVQMTREVVGTAARVVVPVGLQLRYAVELAKRGCEAGGDGLLVMPLSFPYVSNSGARDYYLSLLDSVSCPVLIYKKDVIPSPELLSDLSDHPNFLGVKYSLPDVTTFQRIVERDQGKLDWYCGHAERFAPYFMLAGAPGYTSGAGNLCPRVTLALHRALAAGDYAEALKWQRIIFPIEDYRARDANSYNVSFLKYAIKQTGLDFGEPRPPYRQLTPAEQAEVDAIVAPILAAEASLA
ncbi:MAG: dihydrodipicolinate synthase family protein [Planctomycetales bacterium]|nr:dihydrodipicolinate synthase family protein [Planctomycetales bacterium]